MKDCVGSTEFLAHSLGKKCQEVGEDAHHLPVQGIQCFGPATSIYLLASKRQVCASVTWQIVLKLFPCGVESRPVQGYDTYRRPLLEQDLQHGKKGQYFEMSPHNRFNTYRILRSRTRETYQIF